QHPCQRVAGRLALGEADPCRDHDGDHHHSPADTDQTRDHPGENAGAEEDAALVRSRSGAPGAGGWAQCLVKWRRATSASLITIAPTKQASPPKNSGFSASGVVQS